METSYSQAVKGSVRLLNSAKWGEDDVFIVKHKDTEPSSSTTWNQQMPIYPPVDFSKVRFLLFREWDGTSNARL